MASQQFINKATYQEWEAKVIKLFYSHLKDTHQDLDNINKDLDNTKIFAATKRKVIVVIIPHVSHPMSYVVESNCKISLPNKSKLDMYHIGNGQTDKVSYGLENDTFFYPACDVGGLTNYRHKMGTKPEFALDENIIYNPFSSSQVDPLYEKWLELSGRESFTDDVKLGFDRWVESMYHLHFGKMSINFVVLPIELRVIVHPDLVREQTGAYYTRTFGQDDEEYAQVSNGNNLWCGVSETYITPNLNDKNLQNEYV